MSQILQNHQPIYDIGDVLKVEKLDYVAYFLIEDKNKYNYHYRNLTTGQTDYYSIWYLDNNKNVKKVA